MMIEAVGAVMASCSAVARPSMPGMLMSSRMTSVGLLSTTFTASSPEPTLSVTTMSLSKLSSLARCSRVSAMSSTITTLIGSATIKVASLARRRLGRRYRERRQHAVLVDELAQRDAAGRNGSGGVVGRRPKDQRDAAIHLRKPDHFDLLRLD